MSFRRRTSETLAGLQRELEALRVHVESGPAPAAPPPLPIAGDGALPPPQLGTSLSDVNDLVRSLAERVDGLDRRQLEDHERLSLRLEELTTQFTNQLVEMSNELDAGRQHVTSQLAAQQQRLEELAVAAGRDATADGAGAPGLALVEELRTNQVRIANDLARHEIAVRQDLAALAELVHRSRRSTG